MPKSTLRQYLAELKRQGAPGAAAPARKDKRGCKGCREKLLRKAKDAVTVSKPAAPMKLAPVITSFNEGDEVYKTADSLVRSMVLSPTRAAPVVIDDGSAPAVEVERLRLIGVSRARHEEAQGVGRSRNAGAAVALDGGADAVSFHDAHMRFPPGVMEALARKAVETGAIVTSKAAGWWDKKTGKLHSFRAWGADLHWNIGYGLQAKYRIYPKNQPEWIRVPCAMGACYVMSRQTIEKLSAPTGRLWDDVAGRWGFSEQALAVKAFLLGIPTLVSRDLQTHHLYKESNPVPNAGIETWKNICYSMAALLSEETFDERFRPCCETYIRDHVDRLAKQARADRPGGAKAPLPWTYNQEQAIFTDLCGRGAKIAEPHADHAWLPELTETAQKTATGLDRAIRILQWRPGESTVLLRRHFAGADITCLEWNRHRATNWAPLLKRMGVRLLQVELRHWTNPQAAGFLKDEKPFDLITLGGEMADACKPAAQRLLAPGGAIVVNTTADAYQIEDKERFATGDRLEAYRKATAAGGAKKGANPTSGDDTLNNRQPSVTPKPASPTVTVVLLNWRRPENIGPVLHALARQTVRPRVILWDNGFGESGGLKYRAGVRGLLPIDQHRFVDLVVSPSRNLGCMPRWWLAAMAETDYVCSLDDDLAPADERVLADAIDAQRRLCPEGIVGPFAWQRVEGKSYKAARHFNGRSKEDRRVDVVKGRMMLFPTRLLARVPLGIPGADLAEDDVYLNLCVSRGLPGYHLVPGVLAGRLKQVGKEDARSRALRPGHYEHREECIKFLTDYWRSRE